MDFERTPSRRLGRRERDTAVRRTISTDTLFQICNLRERWILATGAEKVTEGLEGDTTVASLVEQRKRFLVVGRGLRDD